jgi:DNA polymerase-1
MDMNKRVDKKCIMIVDSLSIGHSVKYSTKKLSFAGRKTGIIFGFLKKLLVVAEEILPTDVVFCWDTQASIRKTMYKGYKANRKTGLSNEDKLLNKMAREQFETLETIVLPQLGFKNIFSFPGYESDDIIASIVINETSKYKCIMVTRDKDMLQLLSNNCSMYEHTTKAVTTAADFISEWGMDPYEWAAVKAIAGCKSDDIPGIKGIGEKTAAAFLKGDLKMTSKKMLDIIAGKDTILPTLELVHLPLDRSLMNKVLLSEDVLSVQKYIDVCNKFGFESMLGKIGIDRWEKAFNIS